MDILTDHLFSLKLTSDDHMDGSSSEIQHSNFARQLSALEKLLIISYSKLSVQDLQRNLKLVLKAGRKGMLKITSLNSLRECIETYKTTSKDGKETKAVVKFFDDFMSEIQYLTRLKNFFHETIYHCLYEYFYNPIYDDSDDELTPDGLSDDDDDDDGSGEKSDVDLEKEQRVKSPAPAPHEEKISNEKNKATESEQNTSDKQKRRKTRDGEAKSSKKKKKKKKKKMEDNRLKVLERIQKEKAEKEALKTVQKLDEPKAGKEFDKLRNKTDNHRLAYAVKEIFDLQKRWGLLLSHKTLNLVDFEEESLKDLRDCKNYNAFEPVLRLLPDLLAKGFRIVELAKLWYNSYRRSAGPGPFECRTVDDFYEYIKTVDISVKNVDTLIENEKNSLDAKQHERRLLLNQLMRLDRLKERHDQAVEKERELKEYYRQLKQERASEYPKLDVLKRDDPEYKEVYEQIQYLADSMKKVYRELQTASYEVALVKQDLDVEIGNRSNLIHIQSDIKQAILDVNKAIEDKNQKRDQYMHTSEKIREKCQRMQRALYGNVVIEESIIPSDNSVRAANINEKVDKPHANKKANYELNTRDSDQDEVDRAIEDTLNQGEHLNLERTNITKSSDSNSLTTPPPPLDKPNARKSKFVPNSSGLTDEEEAREYDERVKRLQQFNIDLSDLNINPHTQAYLPNPESGDGEDMETVGKVRKNIDRYSPLSDVSDEYIFKQPHPTQSRGRSVPPPKTIYVLKKHSPRNVKSKPINETTIQNATPSQDDTPSPESHHMTNTPHKKSPAPSYLSPARLKHVEGVFTPLRELSEGDITEDSGTGNSLDSETSGDEQTGENTEERDEQAEYTHKSRIPVREQFAMAKRAQKNAAESNNKEKNQPKKSKLPTPTKNVDYRRERGLLPLNGTGQTGNELTRRQVDASPEDEIHPPPTLIRNRDAPFKQKERFGQKSQFFRKRDVYFADSESNPLPNRRTMSTSPEREIHPFPLPVTSRNTLAMDKPVLQRFKGAPQPNSQKKSFDIIPPGNNDRRATRIVPRISNGSIGSKAPKYIPQLYNKTMQPKSIGYAQDTIQLKLMPRLAGKPNYPTLMQKPQLNKMPLDRRVKPAAPRKTVNQRVRVLESQSDSEGDEIFKQTSIKYPKRTKPTKRSNVLPQRRTKRNGVFSLGRVH